MKIAVWLALLVWAGSLYCGQNDPRGLTGGGRPVFASVREETGTGPGFKQGFLRAMDNTAMHLALGALVPGLPQLMDGQWRAYGYFAVEAASLAGIVSCNAQAHARQKRFDIISRTARENFPLPGLRNNATEQTDPLLHGYGEYYEDLTKWPSSGDYDNDPSLEGLQPETDPRTYNGHQWKIAQINNYSGTNGGIPVPKSEDEVQRAIEAYKQAVYPTEYNWDWTGLDLEQAEYYHVFNQNEVSYRRRNKFTFILLANHLASAIDVLIQEKINSSRRMKAAGLELRLEMGQTPGIGGAQIRPALSLHHQF
jgi:hypothetical protein